MMNARKLSANEAGEKVVLLDSHALDADTQPHQADLCTSNAVAEGHDKPLLAIIWLPGGGDDGR